MNSGKILLLALLLILPLAASAAGGERFVSKAKLASGETVVIAEGDLEARSIGSYSIRLYEKAEAGDETTFFKSGIIHERDGTIEKLIVADVNGDKKEDIVVAIRSAGSGDYLYAQAYSIDSGQLKLVGEVEGLVPTADPVAELQNQLIPKKSRG